MMVLANPVANARLGVQNLGVATKGHPVRVADVGFLVPVWAGALNHLVRMRRIAAGSGNSNRTLRCSCNGTKTAPPGDCPGRPRLSAGM
jgi:hypothetical protein